ncbi:monothiol glutaredoxin-S1-like [Salvia miltiorrhiza]|uniref:monothiol glutaredoxin-S1-like n=1 Tax=Salvia miltiorrhiza TaxID=226208 RepID=UPI0025AD4087|nr:monothiol glutaredoxin-S1-like [Salvia miltiorrhiza]
MEDGDEIKDVAWWSPPACTLYSYYINSHNRASFLQSTKKTIKKISIKPTYITTSRAKKLGFRRKMEAINRLTADKPVVIFSKSTCCMSHTIKTLICSFGANPTVYELDELPNGQQLERALTTASGRRTSFPAVFIDQELVGGANEVMSLHVKGELVPLLRKARAIWV